MLKAEVDYNNKYHDRSSGHRGLTIPASANKRRRTGDRRRDERRRAVSHALDPRMIPYDPSSIPYMTWHLNRLPDPTHLEV